MNKKDRVVISWVAQELTASPEEWRTDGYRVIHSSGVWVWIANSYYGMSIGFGENQSALKGAIGGVTGWSTFFGPMIPWRRRVFNAAIKVMSRKDSLYEHINDYERKKNASLKVVK